jgi:phage terminase large subunit-like protein
LEIVNPSDLPRESLLEIGRRLESNHPFYTWQPFPKQEKVLKAKELIKALVGANRVGKTETAAYMAVARAVGFDPALSRSFGKFVLHSTPAHVWCVSLDTNVSRDVLEPKVLRFLPDEEIVQYKAQDKIYKLRGGSTIGFKSCDSGAKKFQGTERHLIVFDEEPPYDVVEESVMRIMTVGGTLVFSFTPLNGSQWLHDLLYDPDHLGLGSLGIFTQEMGMVDNPTLSKFMIDAAKEHYSGIERDIRVYGKYVVMAAGKFFDYEKGRRICDWLRCWRRQSVGRLVRCSGSQRDDVRAGMCVAWSN